MTKKRTQNQTDRSWLAVTGLVLAFWAASGVGCTNNRVGTVDLKAAAAARALHSTTTGSPQSADANAASLAGDWLCTDQDCPADTIKTISPKLDSIETSITERLTPANPQSICRFEQTEILRISSDDSVTAQGTLSQNSAHLMPALENTRDCADVMKRIAEIKHEPVSIKIEREKSDDCQAAQQILINGSHYRRLSDLELETINSNHYKLNAEYASVAGQWTCIDEGCGELSQTISADLKVLTSDSVIELPVDGAKCHVTEQSSLAVKDSTDPQKIYLDRTYGQLKVVDSPENMSDCAAVAKDFNDEREQKHPESERITIERDGNQEIILLGKRYARKK